MFNPNSAFPRQSVYVPWTSDRHGGPQRAVNAPNFGDRQAQFLGALPSGSAYPGVAQRAQRVAGGATGVAAGIAALAARPSPTTTWANRQQSKANLQQHNAKRVLYGQGKPVSPEAESVGGQAAAVIQSGMTPISIPGIAAFNESMTKPGKRRGAAPFSDLTQPIQTSLF